MSTNYYKLNSFENYVEDFNKNKHANKFKEINLGIKIMPSYNLEKNILFMRHSTDVSKKNLIKFLNFKFLAFKIHHIWK